MSMTPEEIAAKTTADAAAAESAKGGKGTAMGGGEEKPETWIPEKYHVRADGKKEGPIDEKASLRALAKGYGELAKKMVDTGAPPDSPEAYELEAREGFDIAEFRKDPKMTDFLKGAHSLGASNKLINYVVNKYLEIAPELAGAAAELSNEECVAQLGLVWKSEAELTGNLKASHTAATKLAESIGMTYDDLDAAFGNNPLFIRLMAGLAVQMGEDVPPMTNGAAGDVAVDFDAQTKALRGELEKIPEHATKERAVVHAKLNALYEKRYGTGKRAPVFSKPAQAA